MVASLAAAPRAQAPAPAATARLTLRLHPDNPRYFLFRGRPTVVITSGEHYGAVLNLDFDYRRYLATLADARLNGTRIFSGSYVETGGNFDIAANTLDPASGRFISPWARSTTPGYSDGGAKFDLTRFDDAYVTRLRAVLQAASEYGVIVELVIFCPLYEDSMWAVSPLNPANNVNGFGASRREDVLTLDRSGPLLAVQEAVARRLVQAVAGFDNVYLEICNEPYATKVPDDWLRHMTTVVADAVARLPQPVLLSHNIANQELPVNDPHPAVSIFNFHYATPPDTIAQNWHLKKLIGDNETGFRGTGDAAYRTEGWDFILAGGGLYNNLDYSFTVGHEDGTFQFPATQPGGGGVALRKQLGVLRQFVGRFDLVKARPAREILASGAPPGGSAQAFTDGAGYGVYLRRQAAVGAFSARWSGTLRAPVTGNYQIHATSNDGVRVRAGSVVLIDDWTDHATKTDTVSVQLEANAAVSVSVDYFYAGGAGVMKLEWTRPDGVRETIPAGVWRGSSGPRIDGLKADYFHGTEIHGRYAWFTRREPTIDHDFGTKGPRLDDPAMPAGAAWTLDLRLPAGTYDVTWVNPVTGETIQHATFIHGPGDEYNGRPTAAVAHLQAPQWQDDVAVYLRRDAPPAVPVPR